MSIGCDVWIGSGVTILDGVAIGHGAVIAANSTVTKNVGPYEIFGGNPAKLIRTRFDRKTIDKLLELSWWDLPIAEIKNIRTFLNSVPNDLELDVLLENSQSAPGLPS